jgi:hypothetical protein
LAVLLLLITFAAIERIPALAAISSAPEPPAGQLVNKLDIGSLVKSYMARFGWNIVMLDM